MLIPIAKKIDNSWSVMLYSDMYIVTYLITDNIDIAAKAVKLLHQTLSGPRLGNAISEYFIEQVRTGKDIKTTSIERLKLINNLKPKD